MTGASPLRQTWRPLGTRLAGTIFGGALVVLVVVVWIAFGASVRARFTPIELGTLVFLGLLALAVWWSLMRSKVTATEQGLSVINGYKRREYEWAQVLGITLRRGAPWASLDLSDGTSVSVMAIQGSDGDRAISAVRALRRIIRERSAEHP